MCAWREKLRHARAALAAFSRPAVAALVALMAMAPVHADDWLKDDIGKPLTAAEIAIIDRDARPDGAGLPPGSGTVAAGEEAYLEHCAACHGEFGEGLGWVPALLGGEGTLATETPRKSIGSFWPHAPGVFDHVWRAMPEGHAFSLAPKQVYALTAFLLHINGLVADDFVASAQSLPRVRMPNRDGFVMPPHPRAQGMRCMTKCRNKPPRIAAQAPRKTPGVMAGEREEP